MAVSKLILIFAILRSTVADQPNLLNPCEVKDIECLSETTQNFLEKTSAGIPNFDIKPIDPLQISELTFPMDEFNMKFHFKNINVTGLKGQKISEFKLNKAAQSVVLQTRVDDAHVVADLVVEFSPSSTTLSGTYYAKTTVIGTARYTYKLIPNKDGVEYFDVGPETITCEALGVPEITLDSDFAKTIASHPDAVSRKEGYEKDAVKLRKAVMAKIFEKAYVTVIHNIRAAAKVFPKTAFFKDM